MRFEVLILFLIYSHFHLVIIQINHICVVVSLGVVAYKFPIDIFYDMSTM